MITKEFLKEMIGSVYEMATCSWQIGDKQRAWMKIENDDSSNDYGFAIVSNGLGTIELHIYYADLPYGDVGDVLCACDVTYMSIDNISEVFELVIKQMS